MKDRIDNLLESRITELVQKVADGEEISQDEFDSVKRLAELIDLAASARAGRFNKWPIAVGAVITLALVSGLLFLRVRTTEIELEARLSQISFTTVSRQAILGTHSFQSVGVNGLQQVRLPDSMGELVAQSEELCNAEFSTTPSSPSGTVSLDSLVVPAGTRVTVTYPGADRVELTLRPPAPDRLELAVSVNGDVHSVARCPTGTLNEDHSFSSPELADLVGSTEAPLGVQLYLRRESPLAFSSQMEVSDLSFVEVAQVIDDVGALIRQISSVSSGIVYLEALNGRQITLRPYEDLRFSRSDGVIRKLSLSSQGPDTPSLAIHAYGNVQGMTIGSQTNSRSLMPTYLEWLSARQSLALLWGSTLYLMGLLASMLRWLSISR